MKQNLDKSIEQIQDKAIRSILSSLSREGKELRNILVDAALETLVNRIIALERRVEKR